jgi:hydrogenase nickel incorporation protein HypB
LHEAKGGSAMCGTCGCGTDRTPHSGQADTRRLTLEERVLARNDALAAANRRHLADAGVRLVNLMSSPGSGKTTLLERTIRELGADWPIAVVEGDQATSHDAERIRAAGAGPGTGATSTRENGAGQADVLQINTGDGCHLDAAMLAGALSRLRPGRGHIVFVENVGNLVCPALFDLGENDRVVVMSVTEGTDKPVKYPRIFAVADLVLINKVDLLPYVDFDLTECRRLIRSVSPDSRSVPVSATTGEGFEAWYEWLLPHPGRTVGKNRATFGSRAVG